MRWMDVRTLLEVDSAGLAAVRASAADHSEVVRLREQRDGVGSPEVYSGLTLRFHLAMARDAELGRVPATGSSHSAPA